MHIYFSGLGGVAIGPLALIARDAGYEVSGSDLKESRNTKIMRDAGVDVAIGQDGSQIAAAHNRTPIDWLVISAAVPADHPEVIFAEQHGIRVTKRADMLNQILRDQQLELIAISGTHGKTTTTAMLVWLFLQYDKPVSYSIGTSISFGPNGSYQKGSQYFVYEADEFDRNMLEFHPYTSLITMVDYDHSDIYPTRKDYDNAFIQFAAQSQKTLVWESDANRLEFRDTELTILHESDEHIPEVRLAGLHNRLNAWQAVSAFSQLFPAIPIDELLISISAFPGTDRRFEKLAPQVYTGYDHHPTEIRAALQMARELSDDVVVVYQPHQNVRQHEIKDEYQDCFAGATHVYWLPTYLSREDPTLPILSPEELVTHLTDPSVAEIADMNELLADRVQQAINRGALVLFLGAGDIDDWARTHFATKN